MDSHETSFYVVGYDMKNSLMTGCNGTCMVDKKTFAKAIASVTDASLVEVLTTVLREQQERKEAESTLGVPK